MEGELNMTTITKYKRAKCKAMVHRNGKKKKKDAASGIQLTIEKMLIEKRKHSNYKVVVRNPQWGKTVAEL